MANASIYLNFNGNAEEAFNLYKKAFGTELFSLMRFKDTPQGGNMPEADGNKVAHAAMPILGGLQIMATDMLESWGQKVVGGNNFSINLSPDSKEEADRLYADLSEGGTDSVAPHDEFWGYGGSCTDRFGIRWMINVVKWQQ